ncbi:hypothetical protein [Burkholderia sp. BCC1999]|uniref:hypothetical protein n=1 Tax=Burkholderia sp. BCC1999 TaxID=2817448 RepID=UPI002AC36664|nr:hypothetical protein [Burkholderia sp. BCC1999]
MFYLGHPIPKTERNVPTHTRHTVQATNGSLELALCAFEPGSRAAFAVHDGAEFTASIYAARVVQRMIRAIVPRSVAVPHKNVDKPMTFICHKKYLNETRSAGKTFAFHQQHRPLRNDTP